jgi:hypothetical protein
MSMIIISETMEQVHKHFEKYLALHREIIDDSEVISRAVAERWPGADPLEVLHQAEINSLIRARNAMYADPRKNKWITTTAQGDLFHAVPVRVPSVLIVDGRPLPYYEATILDGLEWWQARRDAKTANADSFAEAERTRRDEAAEAAEEAEKLAEIVRTATANGIDPRSVRYAKTQTQDEIQHG